MAEGLMASAILAIMKADFDLDTIDLRYLATSSSYTWAAAHDFLSDVTNIISDVVAVTGETVAGVSGGANLDHADFTLTNVTGTVARIMSYDHNGGADSARKLVGTYTTGLPIGPLTAGSIAVTVAATGALAITSSPS